jgi:hypothetical protein
VSYEMKILFLDFDGVLNSQAFWEWCHAAGKTPRETSDMLDPEAIKQLNRIVKTTGAHIVVSSSWRLFGDTNTPEKLQAVLRLHGYEGSVLDITPHDMGCDWHDGPCDQGHRGGEINQWLVENKHIRVNKFAIVDDGSDMHPYEDRLVQTSIQLGLQDVEGDEIIELLR